MFFLVFKKKQSIEKLINIIVVSFQKELEAKDTH